MHNNGHLNGWKEIGSYLGRVVRTAQRWEVQLGMPVHRPATRKRSAVVAFRHELDTWLVANRSRLDSYETYDTSGSTATYETSGSTTSYETAVSISDIAALREKLTRLQSEATQLALEIQRARG